jgi:hypothetical protein
MQFPQLLALPPDNVTTYEMCSGPSPDRDGARCGCYAQVTGQRLCDPRRGLASPNVTHRFDRRGRRGSLGGESEIDRR